MKRKLIKRNKKWLNVIYKSSSYQHLPMYDEIQFINAVNRKRNVIRIERRHPSFLNWERVKFHKGYAVVPCYDWKGNFAYDYYLYSVEQLPIVFLPFWIPPEIDISCHLQY